MPGHIDSYIANFLTASEQHFYATQTADLNAGPHEKTQPLWTVYLLPRSTMAGRRKTRPPRVDTNIYPRENGLAVRRALHRYTKPRKTKPRSNGRAAPRTRFRDASHRRWQCAPQEDRPAYLADAAAIRLGADALGDDYREKAPANRRGDGEEFRRRSVRAVVGNTHRTRTPSACSRAGKQPFVQQRSSARTSCRGWAGCRAQGILAAIGTHTALTIKAAWWGRILLALMKRANISGDYESRPRPPVTPKAARTVEPEALLRRRIRPQVSRGYRKK